MAQGVLTSYYARQICGKELSVYQCGEEECTGGHYFGPAIRNYYLIHCIHSGKGTYCRGNQRYSLGPGDGFLILPGESAMYRADQDEPWHYTWVGFQGEKAQELLSMAGLGGEQVVFHCGVKSGAFDSLISLCRQATGPNPNDFSLLGYLYLFLSQMMNPDRLHPGSLKKGQYYDKAIQFIANNYAYDITIPMVAEAVGINRSHLFKVFKEKIGLSPQEFLIQYRIIKATELFDTTDLNVTEVAFSTGFKDPSHFSKVFRSIVGCSPKEYEKTAEPGMHISLLTSLDPLQKTKEHQK